MSEKEEERFLVIKYSQQGVSKREIARRLKKNRRWVNRAIDRFIELKHFGDRPRQGAPPKLTSQDKTRLVKFTKGKRRKSTRKAADTFITKKGKRVSHETVRKVWQEKGLYPHRARKAPMITEPNKEKRVRFAEKYHRADFTNWVFYDEKVCELYHRANPKNEVVWNSHGVAIRHEEVAHPPTFNFGAAITARGPTRLVPYSGTIDAPKYQEMITGIIDDVNQLYPEGGWVWVQDSAKPHTAKTSQKFLGNNVPRLIPPHDWPATSPDINVIENIFGDIQDKIDQKDPPSVRALGQLVKRLWSTLTPESCSTFISDLPRVLKQIIETKGEYFSK